jgi:hypothetical protein
MLSKLDDHKPTLTSISISWPMQVEANYIDPAELVPHDIWFSHIFRQYKVL